MGGHVYVLRVIILSLLRFFGCVLKLFQQIVIFFSFIAYNIRLNFSDYLVIININFTHQIGRSPCACTICHFIAKAVFDGEYLTSLKEESGLILVMSETPSKLL